MLEHDHYDRALMAAEAMYNLLELQWQAGEVDPDAMLVRIKDLSAYSLSHADIQERRQVVELLALGMLFGLSSDPRYHANQERLQPLSEETLRYEGQAEKIVGEIQEQGNARRTGDRNTDDPPRLF